MPRFRTWYLLPLAILLGLAWLACAPGLSGGFLFDDYGNLPAIGATGPIHDWPAFWRYITSGTAGPLGRPLSLLGFLVDARDWPAAAYPFKRTSLVLHLCNGVLLTLLLRQLGRELSGFPPRSDSSATPAEDLRLRIDLAAILGAGFWLLHPLFVSTTLYVVQREAMLPATFTLVGLLLWLHGRARMLRGHCASGATWMVLGLGGCTLLAVLSKENGILLPALALVTDWIVRGCSRRVRPLPASPVPSSGPVQSDAPADERTANLRACRWTLHALAWPPTLAVAAYLAYQGWHGVTHGIASIRPWSLGERLLTEPRVLMDYLGLLWLPRPFTPGLFNDQVQASTTLLTPLTTLPALLGVVALIACAVLLRSRWPALALAILFYFVGQSLESSTIALELFFEHRNYLPAMLMFWPLALWLCGVRQDRNLHDAASRPAGLAGVKAVLAGVLLLGLGSMTYARSTLWGDTRNQALLWATINPDSPRAQANAAQSGMDAGLPALAVARLRPMVAKFPGEVQLVFNLVGAECQTGHVDPATIAAARTALRTTRDPGALLTTWFDRAIGRAASAPCPELTAAQLRSWLEAANSNPRIGKVPGRRQDVLRLFGRIALARRDADTALADFNRALDQEVRIGLALEQAALLGSAGFPRQALAHLDHYDAERALEHEPNFGMARVHAWLLSRQGYWRREQAHLRATLRGDAKAQGRGTG